MISSHTIRAIARFESKALLRSWFFRIFAGLTILILGIFNIVVYMPNSDAPFLYRAIPCAIPYANLILLNLGQAIVAIFLASEFLKQDSKNDTVEVIYARSMTNSEYIIGKTIGILSLFLILNLIVLLIGTGFSFLSNESSLSVGQLLLYPFLISIPTLVFILGLSFFLMILLKNQAITFIVLLGYIALSLFYLNDKLYHLFDYIAYQIPMMNSTIGGFGNLYEVVIHRGIYFFLGLGMILFTIFKLNRLPQAKRLVSLPIYLAIISMGIAGFLTFQYLDGKNKQQAFKQEMIQLNDQYDQFPIPEISACNLQIEHVGEEIIGTANLTLVNQNQKALDTLLFSLNPALQITKVTHNQKEINYLREKHLLKILSPKSLAPQESTQIQISYRGKIDERVHFLEQNNKQHKDDFSFELFRIRKRYSYVQEDFVCLTKYALWYPIAGINYSSSNPAYQNVDFTQYHVKVKTQGGLVPLSQGKAVQNSTNEWQFTPEQKLPQISLLIGKYQQHSTTVDSVEYSIYNIQNNAFFLKHFQEVQDSLPSLIRELKNELESKIGLAYPFKRFILAEVPIQFSLDKHLWSSSSDAVQPEIIFYPEKGIIMEETNFAKRKERFKRRMKRNNEEVTEVELQSRMFKRFVRANFNPPVGEWYRVNIIDRNTYSPFPNYFDYTSQLESEEFPVLNLALGSYLKDKDLRPKYRDSWQFDGISKSEKVNLDLKNASLKELIQTGVDAAEKDWVKYDVNEILFLKGRHLFHLLEGYFGEKEFENFVKKYLGNQKEKTFHFSDFDQAIQKEFHQSIRPLVENWYNSTQLPGFILSNLDNYRIKDGEHIKYQIVCELSNPEDCDGIASISIKTGEQNQRGRRGQNEDNDFKKLILVPAKSAKKIGFVFTSEPSGMNINTFISQNLPNRIEVDFESFSQLKKRESFDAVEDCEINDRSKSSKEIIVDNEDDTFSFYQESNKSALKRWLDAKKVKKQEYSVIRTWRPPNEWKNVLNSGFYGKYVRSAYYTKSGSGERKAQWKAPLKESGYYDVYCHIKKIDGYWRSNKKNNTDYTFLIQHENGSESIHKSDQELEDGWNYLGTYSFSPDAARVELTNKSNGKYIFADAVKWVKTE